MLKKEKEQKPIDYSKVPPEIFNKHWQELTDTMSNIEQSLVLLTQGLIDRRNIVQDNKCYSTCGEEFKYECLGELICDEELQVGDEVFVGDAVKPSASDFICVDHILESMCENAYGELGECAEDWPDLSKDEKQILENMIAEYVEKVSPITFYAVKNVVSYILTEDDVT